MSTFFDKFQFETRLNWCLTILVIETDIGCIWNMCVGSTYCCVHPLLLKANRKYESDAVHAFPMKHVKRHFWLLEVSPCKKPTKTNQLLKRLCHQVVFVGLWLFFCCCFALKLVCKWIWFCFMVWFCIDSKFWKLQVLVVWRKAL